MNKWKFEIIETGRNCIILTMKSLSDEWLILRAEGNGKITVFQGIRNVPFPLTYYGSIEEDENEV